MAQGHPASVGFLRSQWPRLSVAVGVLLLVAAGLKLLGHAISAVPPVGRLSHPQVQMAAVVWEVLLGVWLLSARRSAAAWLAALLTFLVFAGVSGTLGWGGVARCGCFGMIEASPWSAFALDVGVLLLLVVFRPPLGSFGWAGGRDARGWAVTAAGVVVAVGTLAAAGVLGFGSVDAAVASARGEDLTVSPAVVDCGEGLPGEQIYGLVAVTNRTDRPIRLIGGTSDCSCSMTDGLPLTVPPRQTVQIGVRVRVPVEGKGGEAFVRSVEILAADDALRPLELGLIGRVAVR